MVLPLLRRDLDRSVLLRETLARHASSLGTGWVIAPDDDVQAIRGVFEAPRWEVLPESELVAPARRRLGPIGRRLAPERRGWAFQQVLKLAAVARSPADFSITLDADVIALRELDEASLAPGGRAWSQVEPPPQAHPHWYDGAAAILGLPRSALHHAVTPAILSPEVCRELIEALEAKAGRRDADWVDMLLRRSAWSEYALYNTFLEGTGRVERYHQRVHEPVLYADAVWFPEDFGRWQAGRESTALFTLVQSTAGISVDEVRRRLDA